MHFSELSPRPRTKRQKVAAESAANIVEMSNDELGRLKADAAQTARYLELWVHETKTPLSAAKLIANRIDDKLAATEILAELERIESQVAQALFAAKSNHLESDYSIREVSLIDIASEVCKQNMHLLIELGLSARIEIEPELTVFADPSWTSFIISQIIANSAKYDSTSIQISATAAEAESPDSATILRISDNGCGIPAHDALRIFERGFIGDVGRSHGSATGMGLYLVSDMCAKMGLGLEVSTEEDVGTTVSISFPHDRRRTLMSGQNLSTSHNLTRS